MPKLSSLVKRLQTHSYDGFILPISRDSWSRIDRKVRNEIRKAEKSGLKIRRDTIAWCVGCVKPYKFKLGKYDFKQGNHRAYVAELDGHEVCRVIFDFAEPLIIYRCACSTQEGKGLNANSLLLWNLVSEFSGSAYRYLVLGFSSIPSIAHFKEQFGVMRFLVPARFWDFLPWHEEEVRAYVIFEKRTTNYS